MEKILLRPVDLEKDIVAFGKLVQECVDIRRYFRKEDVALYAQSFALHACLPASFALKAEEGGEILGVITSSRKGEKTLADDPEILSFARKIQAEAERIPLREDESIYRKTCERILERRKAEYDGEILLFVVTGRRRHQGIGRRLLTSALDDYREKGQEDLPDLRFRLRLPLLSKTWLSNRRIRRRQLSKRKADRLRRGTPSGRRKAQFDFHSTVIVTPCR